MDKNIKKEILDLSQKLVEVESTKSNPQGLKEVIGIAKKYLPGFKYFEFEKNNYPSIFFYNFLPKDKKFKLILNGHLDVVSGKKEQFNLIDKGKYLSGRGSSDMKCGVAVQICVLKILATKNRNPIGLQLVTDEEIGGNDGTLFQLKKGISSEFAISGESTDLKINNTSKGVFWFKLTAKGKSSHGAYLWNGKNALRKLLVAVNRITKVFEEPTKEVWKTTCNLAFIKTANETPNKVPDLAEAVFDIRYVPLDKKIIVSKIKKLIPKGIKLDILEFEPSPLTSKKNVYVKKLITSITKIKGNKVSFQKAHGASDIRHFEKHRINGICFGPIGFGLHSDNEYIDKKSLFDFYLILEDFIKSL